MKFKLAVLALCLFFVGSAAFAATYYIPQVAVGTFAGANDITYSYRTTFVFFNNQNTFTNIDLSLTSQDGSPMLVNIPGVGTNSSTFSFQLGPGSTKIIQTDVSGNARVGAATVTTDLDIGVSGIYTITNENQQKFVTEVGVQGASPATSFAIPVQTTSNGRINTGLALYNPSDSSTSITLALKDVDGTSAGSATFDLAAGAQTAFYVGNKIASVNNTTFSGTLAVQSTAEIAAVALRQNSPSFDTFTSIPVIPTTSTQTSFNLAHIVDGNVGGTPYTTTFMLVNFGTASATVTLAPTKSDGTAWPLTMTDASTTAGTYTIPAGGSKFLVTNGSANDQGAVKITSTAKIGAAALFTQYNNDSSFNTEAGVQDSPEFTDFTLPVDSRVSLDGSVTTSDTGIAFFNPSSSSVTFTPTFLDAAGVINASTTEVTIPAKGHTASFFNQLFPSLGNIQGSVSISGLSNGISAMTLRLNMVPFSMTTLPVVSGVAPGVPAATAGTTVRKIVSGAIAAADTTVNAKLPYGYAVTATATVGGGGSVWAQYGGLGIRAISNNGTIFPLTTAAPYTATLPAGSYIFSVMTLNSGGSGDTANFWFYNSPLVTITSGATVALNCTSPTLYPVTGNITGLNAANTTGKILFYNIDGSQSYGYQTTTSSSYTLQVPNGTFQLSYVTAWPPAATSVWYNNLGTVTVNGAAVTGPNLVIPATLANLSGAVSFSDTAPASMTIRAAEFQGISYVGGTSAILTATATSGAYSAFKVLPTHAYTMSLSYGVVGTGSTATAGTVNYTPVTNNPFTVNSDSTYDFTLPGIPAAPSLVTISGTVTDNAGAAVSGVTVTATSNYLTGATAPGVSYTSATATTSTTGAYSLMVVPGTDYTLSFVK